MTKSLTRFRRTGFSLLSLCLASLFATALFGAEAGSKWTRTPRSPFVGVVKETCKSVVSIQGEKQCEAPRRSGSDRDAQYDVFNGMGTGVVVDERGYIATNYHVVKGLLKLEVIASDGESYRDVELVRNDPATDLAILKIKPRKPLQKIRMGRSDRVELAEEVFAIGNPYGYHCSITRGIISQLDRPLEVNERLSYDRVIQTDAAVNPGNSGGPLVNIDGEMIGLNAAVREDAENIAFAIPVDVVCEVLDKMLRQTVAKMTHHGLKFRVVDYEDPDYPEDGDGRDRLIVESVEPRSPAARAGIEPGDVLLSSNGRETRCPLDFTSSLIGVGPSDSIELEYERGGSTSETSLAFGTIVRDSVANEALATNGARSREYAQASVDEPFAEDASASEERFVSESRETAKSSRTVWDALGIEARAVDSEEYRNAWPNLQKVAIGAFNFAPDGGVEITKVGSSGLFAEGDVKLQEGDLIFGFGVGDSKEGQLGVTSLDNLRYIAKRLDEFAKVDSGIAKVYLIRAGRPYYLELDLNR